jgi:type IX secretion system PorP/SprF family membrane protein
MQIMNKHIHIILFLLALLVHNEAVMAQQEGVQTLFMYNALSVNPAVAGSKETPSFTLLSRHQWLGFKGAPVQQNLGFHATVFSSKRLGFGLNLGNRSAGILSAQTGTMSWSYSPVKTENFSIRMGLSGTIRRLGFNIEDAEQASILSGERGIDLSARMYGNFGMGMLVTYKECFFGVSVPYFYENIIGINEQTPITAVESRHYYIMGGLDITISKKLHYRPTGVWRLVKNAPWGFDFNNSLIFNEEVTVGLGYRAGKSNMSGGGESLDMLLFYQVNPKWGIGCAYDYNISPLKKYTGGSIEVVTRFDLKQTALKLSNPRVFF